MICFAYLFGTFGQITIKDVDNRYEMSAYFPNLVRRSHHHNVGYTWSCFTQSWVMAGTQSWLRKMARPLVNSACKFVCCYFSVYLLELFCRCFFPSFRHLPQIRAIFDQISRANSHSPVFDFATTRRLNSILLHQRWCRFISKKHDFLRCRKTYVVIYGP